MTTAAERLILMYALEKYEGKVNHLYLDSKGLVTVGIGHLLSSAADAQKLPFRNSSNTAATKEEIKTDFEAMKNQVPNKLASSYKKFTTLYLSDDEINKLTIQHIGDFEVGLRRIYIGFDTFPIEARLALFDMAFNVGLNGLGKTWPTMNEAVKAKNWQKAADSSNRKSPVSPLRNKYVKDLFEQAANQAPAPKVAP